MGLQDLVNGYPIHACRLHRHGGDPELDQPGRHAFQISREGLKGLDWLFGESGGHRDHMEPRADIDANGACMNDR
ncbi:hypothetical protein D3C84_1050400 [compost metagenome]